MTKRLPGMPRRLLWPVRMINSLGHILDYYGLHLVRLSEAVLMDEAQRGTGLSDWGDEYFRTPLRVLLDAYENTAQLHLLGRLAIRQESIRLLSNRLRIQKDLKQFPRIQCTPLRRPLIIVGLPRTGTTLLHNLLVQDPSARWPRMWELLQPSPPPHPEAAATDPRIKMAKQMVWKAQALAPNFFAIHPLSATGPEECIFLFQNAFMSIAFEIYSEVPDYLAWLLHQDLTPAYRYYHQQLQLLQWYWPGNHWVLKSPHHLFFLDALLKVFPDACVVQTHRDPSTVMASMCSLMATARSFYSNRVAEQNLGQQCLATWGTALDRMLRVRETADTARFYDLQYDDLIADPIGAVYRIYAYFGCAVTPSMEKGMRRWLSAHPQYQHGVHQYSLTQFGLDPVTVERRCVAYVRKFNVHTGSMDILEGHSNRRI